MRKILNTLLIFCSFSAFSQKQEPAALDLQSQMNLYASSKPQGRLFVHTDKNIYTPNEQIWFSGYLLGKGNVKEDLLQLFLVNVNGYKSVLTQRYLLKLGICAGHFNLNDSVPPGKYMLVAMTNLLDAKSNPLHHYSQIITVKTGLVSKFSAKLDWQNSVASNEQSIRASLNLSFKSVNKGENPSIQYAIDQGEFVNLKPASEQTRIINLSQEEAKLAKVLYVRISYQGEQQLLKLPFVARSYKEDNLAVKFYPEGGQAILNRPTLYKLEAFALNRPKHIKGVLLEDDKPVDSVATNEFGMGKFHLTQKMGSKYALKILSGPQKAKDSIYKIPQAVAHGISILVRQAVVNDTLQFKLYAKQQSTLKVIIHNYSNVFAEFNTSASEGGRNVKLALNVVPKGICVVTVLDSAGSPVAERLFFAHFNQTVKANLVTDQQSYGKRSPIKLHIKLQDSMGSPVQGLFSVAVVRQNRLDAGTLKNIEHSFYFATHLSKVPLSLGTLSLSERSYLENILLGKNLSDHNWSDLIKNKSNDTIVSKSIGFEGFVSRNGKALKKSIPLNFISSDNFGTINTNEGGYFFPRVQDMLTDDSRGITFSVNQENKDGFTISMEDVMVPIAEKYAADHWLYSTDALTDSANFEIKDQQNAIDLGSVSVSAKSTSDRVYGQRMTPGKNKCGDYVDEYGYLNYPPSAGNDILYQPISGKQYKKRTDLDGGDRRFSVEPITYTGCQGVKENLSFNFAGVLKEKPFYVLDPTDQDQQYLSTIFWRSKVLTDKDGAVDLHFMTGDASGLYTITIQGITDEHVVYGTSQFSVK